MCVQVPGNLSSAVYCAGLRTGACSRKALLGTSRDWLPCHRLQVGDKIHDNLACGQRSRAAPERREFQQHRVSRDGGSGAFLGLPTAGEDGRLGVRPSARFGIL